MIYNQRHKIVENEEKRFIFLPLSLLGNTARQVPDKCSIRSKVESPHREKGVLVNTPIFTWAYTRTFEERGRRDP
jgi:hypothetical protein